MRTCFWAWPQCSTEYNDMNTHQGLFLSHLQPADLQPADKQSLYRAVFRNRAAVLSCSLYAILGFVHTMLDETIPLWLIASVSNGGMGKKEVITHHSKGVKWVVTFL